MNVITTADSVAALINSRLSAINIVAGYATDIGLRVFEGRLAIDDSQVPCCSLIEGSDQVQSRPGRLPSAQIVQSYAIVAYVHCDADKPNTAARLAIRDIKRAIFQSDATFGGQVRLVTYKGRNIGPRADGAKIVMAIVEIDVEYVEDLLNP